MSRLNTLNQLKEESAVYKINRYPHFYYVFNDLYDRTRIATMTRYLDWSDENHSHFA